MNCPIYIGRVGALAIALGVGFAVGNGIAWADENRGTASTDSGSSTNAGQTGQGAAANGANRASQAADRGNPGPRSPRSATRDDGSASSSRTENDDKGNTADTAAEAPQSNGAGATAPETKPQPPSAVDSKTSLRPETPKTKLDVVAAPVNVSTESTALETPADVLTEARTATTSQVVSSTTELPITAVDLSTTTDIAEVPQMVAGPEPADAPPNVPLTTSPGLWTVYGNNPDATHPIPSSPAAPAALLSLHWMRREAERAAQQQAPAARTQSTSLTVDPATTSEGELVTALAAPAAVVDDTAALQASFDALRPGDTLTLQARTYYYSDNLYIRRSNVQVNGNGATLYSTNPDAAAVVIQGNSVTVQNLNLSAPTGQVRNDSTSRTRLVFGGNGNVIRDVTITGGASAGVYITGASNFLLERVTVQDTAADGVQITNGSNNGVLNNVTTLRTGDDAIAIVSYQYPALGTVHDIVINNPVVNGAAQRGLVVTGGERITFNNINVSNTKLSGVWIGSQPAPFYTQSVNGVTVNGGVLTNTNSGGLPLGAVAVVAQNPGTIVSNVTIQNLSIVNTPPSSYTNVGLYAQGGTFSNIAFRNIAIWQPIPVLPLPFFTLGTVPGTYTATGFTANGVPVNVTPAGVAV
jgi:hypothetical protein